MASSCKKGYYFCNTSQKCKRIPKGHKVQSDGELVRDYVSDWRSDLGENLGIKMPTVRPGQFTSTGGRGKPVDLPNPDSKQFKSTGGRGKAVDLPKVKSGQFKEEIQGGISVEPYTKDTKFLEVETVDIIKPKSLNASDWRNDLIQVDEKYRYLKTGSYESALNDLVVEILKYDIEDLHNSGFSYEEIAEYYDVKDEVLSEAPAPLVSAGVKILQKVAPKVTKFIANRAVKDSKKVVNWARKPGNWKALNKNIDKVTLPVGKALKQLPARTYAAGQNFRKAVDATYNAGKALRGSTTNALSSAKKNLLPAAKGRLKNVTDAGTRFSNFVDTAYSALEKGTKKVGQKLINRGRQDIAIRNLDKAKINKTKEIFAKVKKLEKKGDVAGDVIDIGKKTNVKKPTTLLNPSGGAITALKNKGSALVAKVRNFFSKKGTKQLTGTKTPNQLSGTNVKGSLPSGSSKGTKSPLDKRTYSKQWMGLQKAADATVKADKASAIARTAAAGLAGLTAGGKVGQEIGKKLNSKKVEVSSLLEPPNENKAISNTEKKTVDPKKNEVVTKTSTKKTTTKKTTSKSAKSKGATKWVGGRTTWTDRHGNVIAPKAKENKKYKYGRTGSHLTPLEQEQAN